MWAVQRRKVPSRRTRTTLADRGSSISPAAAVTISAKNDTAAEKQHNGTLTISVESADPLYAALGSSTLDYTITDDDSAALGAVAGRLWNDADRDGTGDAVERVTVPLLQNLLVLAAGTDMGAPA